MIQKFFLVFLLAEVLLLPGCGVNVFSVEDDINLGEQLKTEYLNSSDMHILPEEDYPEAYAYLNGIKNNILNSGHVKHKDDFDWDLFIVEDDEVVNAFCIPGGHIFVYTGLIRYLDSEDQLAGIMGHEIAHADQRHGTQQMTKVYGIRLLMEIALGNDQDALSGLAENLLDLGFSRSHETDADMKSVEYLCETAYNPDGFAQFFQKMKGDGTANGYVFFLSTHPDPGNRVERIHEKTKALNCTGTATYDDEYAQFKKLFD